MRTEPLTFDQRPEAAVLTAPAAPVPSHWALAVVQAHWGVGGELTPIPGERDANFRVTTQGPGPAMLGAPPAPGTQAANQDGSRTDTGGSHWLLKVSHPIEPAEVTDFQTQALLHLARHTPQLPVQRLAASREGEASVQLPAPDGQMRVVRLIQWLEGMPMPQAQAVFRAKKAEQPQQPQKPKEPPRPGEPAEGAIRPGLHHPANHPGANQAAAPQPNHHHSTAQAASPAQAQRANVARLLARLDGALASLQHPAAQRQLPWDIQRAHHVRPLLQAQADPARRALGLAAMDLFETALPHLAHLPRQPIHNDFNVHNLLVDPAAPERVAGILDFGDMLAAPRVNDLAVAAAYQVDADGDALGTVAAFAAAYHAEAPLSATELDLLWPLVQARLAMVVAISGWRALRQPHHADYLLRNNPISWARLAACAPVTAAQARSALRDACGV